jgi:hypothetical protein
VIQLTTPSSGASVRRQTSQVSAYSLTPQILS